MRKGVLKDVGLLNIMASERKLQTFFLQDFLNRKNYFDRQRYVIFSPDCILQLRYHVLI